VYHTASLVLHLATVLVVFSILRLLAGRVGPAVAGAALFAVHPIQVEAVAWASGAKDLLAGLLGACALYQYLLYAQAGAAGKRRMYYFSGMAILILAMLAKPSAMVVPAVALVLDRAMLGRSWSAVLRGSIGWALAVLPLVIVARLAQTAEGVAGVAMWQRPFIAGEALAFYLWKLIWPVGMTPDYGHRPAVVMPMGNGVWVYVAWMIPAAVGLLLWKFKLNREVGNTELAKPQATGDADARGTVGMGLDGGRSVMWGGAAGGAFLFAVLPMLGFAPFMFQYMSTVADHYLYFAMIGPALGITGLGVWMTRRSRELKAQTCITEVSTPLERGEKRWRRLSRGMEGAFVLVLGLLAMKSAEQIGIWRNEETVWAHSLKVSPNSFVAPNNLAASAGRNAVRLAREAIDAKERGEMARARELMAQREASLRQAVGWLETSIRINPDFLAARINAVSNSMRLGDWERAAEHVEGLLAANQRVPAYQRDNFTTFHDTAGHLWMRLGRYDRAAEHFAEFVRRVPDHLEARRNLQAARSRMAEASLEEGLRK